MKPSKHENLHPSTQTAEDNQEKSVPGMSTDDLDASKNSNNMIYVKLLPRDLFPDRTAKLLKV